MKSPPVFVSMIDVFQLPYVRISKSDQYANVLIRYRYSACPVLGNDTL